MFIPHQTGAVTVAAGEIETADLGHYQYGFEVLDVHASGTLESGADVDLSFEVSMDGTTWYAAPAVNLAGTSLDTLVAVVNVTSTFAKTILRLAAFAPFVRLKMDNTDGVAAAVITAESCAIE